MKLFYSVVILFSFVEISYSQLSSVDLTGESGSQSLNITPMEQVEIYLNTGVNQNVSVTIEYDIDEIDASFSVWNYPMGESGNLVTSFSGVGTYSYTTSDNSGKIDFFFGAWELALDMSYVTITWESAAPTINSFPDDGGAVIQTTSNGFANLKVLDKDGKSALTTSTSLIEASSLIWLESENGYKMGLNSNRICSNTSFGLATQSYLYLTSNSAQFFKTYGNYIMALRDKKVGIGTTNPGTTLDIQGSSIPAMQIKETTLNNTLQIGMASSNTNYSAHALAGDAVIRKLGTGPGLHLNIPNVSNDGASYITIGDDANGRTLNVFNNGKVTIGTTDATIDAKLTVEGRILATEIKVEAQTADFVFADDYNLRSLEEIESFIKANKHLPDIPSAKAMEEEGVNLAEMNKLLLQKVEELTLYAIEKEKEVDQIKTESEVQNAKLQSLEERLKLIEEQLGNIVK